MSRPVTLARSVQTSNMAGGLVVEMHGDIRLDGALAQMLRHHTSTAEEFDDAVAFCQDQFTDRQLGILFDHMGPRLPIAVDRVHVERKNRGRVMRCDMRFNLHVRWTSGRVVVARSHLPETLAAAIQGRPLDDVIQHPYLPHGLVIETVEEQNGQWVLLPKTP